MKNTLTFILLLLTVATVLDLNAQTNNICLNSNDIINSNNCIGDVPPNWKVIDAENGITNNITNDADKGMPMEFTLGGGGVTIPKTGETSFGVDVSISIQPLKQPIWFGVAQSVAWEPSLSGSTDLFADWSTPIIKEKLYLNTGWSVGAVYDKHTIGWRSGPEASLEYYTSGNAFIIVGINYDLITKDSNGNHITTENPLRYSFGIGITF